MCAATACCLPVYWRIGILVRGEYEAYILDYFDSKWRKFKGTVSNNLYACVRRPYGSSLAKEKLNVKMRAHKKIRDLKGLTRSTPPISDMNVLALLFMCRKIDNFSWELLVSAQRGEAAPYTSKTKTAEV
jgi:hypothetical protein